MIKFLLISISFITFLFGELTLDEGMSKIDNFSMQYYYDQSKKLDIDKIDKIKFTQDINNKFSLGYIKGNSWFKLRLTNETQDEDFVLYFTEAFYTNINLFEETQDGWKIEKSGLSEYMDESKREDIYPTFFLKIKPNSSKTLYIQTNSKRSNYGNFEIYTLKAFIFRDKFDSFALYWFYFGTMAIIILFNLFLFTTIRDKIYIYYAAYIFFHSVFIFVYSGLNVVSGLAQWTDLLEASIPLYILFLVLFSNTFFNTKKYLPFVAKILKLFIIVLSFLILLTIIDYDTWFELTIQLVTPFAPLLIFVPVYVLLKGNMEMKYYIVGIIIYVISTIMISLMTGGVIENSDFNHYFFVVGSYIEILFFSFILANRFHTIQKEKIEIQKELLVITNQNEQKLQKKVEERTEKIVEINSQLRKVAQEREYLLKEIHHRVKNNFQVIISLLTIEALKNKNKHYKNFLLELKNRIKSMSHIHKYLLNSGEFNRIKSQEYFEKIISEIEQTYLEQVVTIERYIDFYILTIQEAMAIGVIVNELLANAIKHYPNKNTESDHCHIFISFKVVANSITLIVKDNGPGFDTNKISKDGIGLDLVNQFSKKLGAVQNSKNFSFDSGTKFELTWSTKTYTDASQTNYREF